MGQKVNANSLRMNITDTWKSKWLSKTDFAAKLEQDTRIRAFLMVLLKKAGLVRIDIERFGPTVSVTVKTTKPGMIIGKGGGGVEDLKKKILAHLNLKKLDLKLNIEEVKDVNLQSQVVAQNIADQIEKRIAFRCANKRCCGTGIETGDLGRKIRRRRRVGCSRNRPQRTVV